MLSGTERKLAEQKVEIDRLRAELAHAERVSANRLDRMDELEAAIADADIRTSCCEENDRLRAALTDNERAYTKRHAAWAREQARADEAEARLAAVIQNAAELSQAHNRAMQRIEILENDLECVKHQRGQYRSMLAEAALDNVDDSAVDRIVRARAAATGDQP